MAENNELNRILREGIDAAKSGDMATARRLLRDVIRQQPDNELAWIWLAASATSVEERRESLRRVLQINPNNLRARQALAQIEGTARRSTSEIERANASSGGFEPINIAIMLLVVVAVIGSFTLFSQLDINFNLGGAPDTPTPRPSRTPFPSITPTPEPTDTPIPRPFQGTSGAPTLPPTFTTTPPPLPTHTATPTQTPFPVEEFEVFYTSLTEGNAQPDLYQINGDGSGELFIAPNVREVAYHPAGNQIAFIRNVTYGDEISEAEENDAVNTGITGTFPELFVAPLNNIDDARQITTLQTSVVASPSWSPDGRELVFVSDFNGDEDLWYITPDGENLRPLFNNNGFIERDPAWEPVLGSRRILFASDQNSFGSLEIYSMEIPEPGVDPMLDQLTNTTGSSYAPAWSDNGEMITFVSDRSGDPDIYVTDAEGTVVELVTLEDDDSEDRNPTFTPDGAFVAFTSNRQGDIFQTYLVSLDGAVLVRLTDHTRNDIMVDYRPVLILRLR